MKCNVLPSNLRKIAIRIMGWKTRQKLKKKNVQCCNDRANEGCAIAIKYHHPKKKKKVLKRRNYTNVLFKFTDMPV